MSTHLFRSDLGAPFGPIGGLDLTTSAHDWSSLVLIVFARLVRALGLSLGETFTRFSGSFGLPELSSNTPIGLHQLPT
jgi:hypothetical protein